MSFLKQLLKPFVEFDEDEQPEKKKAAPPPAKSIPEANKNLPDAEKVEHPLVNTTKPSSAVNTQVPSYSASGTLTSPLPEHEKYFEKLIDESNTRNPLFSGADYKEFIDSKLDIDDITDENIKYQTAFNVLRSSGLTKEKLLATGHEYLDIIGRDLNAFQGAHALQYKKELGAKESIVQQKVQQLQSLTQQLNVLKSEINQLTQEINLVKEKMDTTRQSFLLAGEKKQNEIQTELNKIAQYF